MRWFAIIPLAALRQVAALTPSNATYYGSVNITGFPQCAYANCITSNQFSPSKLGCLDATLTTNCLCSKAATPLACSPKRPNDEDNCWWELEDWFKGICGSNIYTVSEKTLPPCMHTCTFTTLVDAGCHTFSRNCLCILDEQTIVNSLNACMAKNCKLSHRMIPEFSPADWRDSICKLATVPDYDMAAFDRYDKKVHDTRIGLDVLCGIVFVVFAGIGIGMLQCASNFFIGCFLVGAVVGPIIILVPIYKAM